MNISYSSFKNFECFFILVLYVGTVQYQGILHEKFKRYHTYKESYIKLTSEVPDSEPPGGWRLVAPS